MATVTELQLFAVDLPFKVTFRHAAAARTSSESLFLRARLDNGAEGWGEALPRAYVSGEGREQAFALLRDTILPALVGQSFRSLPEAVSFLEKCDGKAPPEWVHPEVPQTAAWCSVDLALLDAFGRASGEPARPAAGFRHRRPRPLGDTATASWCPPAEAGPMQCRCSRSAPSGSGRSS
jgi:L-alanine-DL-glutamate epimerase-like enolase superfamily enzyme